MSRYCCELSFSAVVVFSLPLVLYPVLMHACDMPGLFLSNTVLRKILLELEQGWTEWECGEQDRVR
jgi:hypothetical protein